MISGVGVWPKAADIEHFHRNFGGRIPEGLLHSVVPAAPSIWIAALARFGTMSFGEVAASAIRFAREGFPTYPFLAEQLAARRNDFAHWPTTAAIFLPDGRPPEVGEIFVQSDLARTLQYMADQERAHAQGDRLAGLKAARDAFYRGDIAGAIVRHQQENGGWLTEHDLADFHSPIEPPCRIRFGEFDVYGCGAWSQGPMVLEALGILKGLDLRGMGHNSAAYIHAVTEALKLAAADREVYFGDPAFVDVPLDVLLSDDYAARRRAQIDPGQGVARHAAGRRGRRCGDPAVAPRSFGGRAAGNRRWQAGDVVPVCRRPSWQCVRRHAERSDDQRGRWCRAPESPSRCGVRAATPGRIIRRASVPDGVRACRPIRRSRSGRARS